MFAGLTLSFFIGVMIGVSVNAHAWPAVPMFIIALAVLLRQYVEE